MARNVLNISIPENSEETTLFVSPLSSNGALTPKVNAKPELNERLIKDTRKKGFVPPEGIFSKMKNRPTLESNHWGKAPFFPNAKPASMLERGWILSLTLVKGERGLLKINDGTEMQIEVIEGRHLVPESNNDVYTVKDLDTSETLDLRHISMHKEWEFYLPTTPVPFIPRRQSLAQEWIKSDFLRMKKGVQGLIKVKDGPEMEVEVIKEFHRIEVMDASGNLIKDTVCSVKDIHTGELHNFSMGKHFKEEWDFYIRKPLSKGGSKKRKVKKGKKTRKARRKA